MDEGMKGCMCMGMILCSLRKRGGELGSAEREREQAQKDIRPDPRQGGLELRFAG